MLRKAVEKRSELSTFGLEGSSKVVWRKRRTQQAFYGQIGCKSVNDIIWTIVLDGTNVGCIDHTYRVRLGR